MSKLIELFRWIYEHFLGLFISRETGEMFTKAALVTAVVVTVGVIYALYAAAISAISLALPQPFNYGLIFLPDNTTAVLTVITSLRVGLFIASLKLGFASIGVR